ncbi:MAG: hypothetical protein KDA58_02330 [Planctomycetaceae bacterium]|nr:hypothetical protein [Planctomycetaceae bacterium]
MAAVEQVVAQQAASTSTEESRRIIRTELCVIGCLLVLLLTLEHVLWMMQDRLSLDVKHLRSLGDIARRLQTEADESDLRVLFLGNSMTRYGVDGEVFEHTYDAGHPEHVSWAKVTPDNTAIPDWYYAYLDFFERPHQLPDVIVLGFEGQHLQDQPSHHPNRLAQYYCQRADWHDLNEYDLAGFEARMDYLSCRASTAWANRDRVERRVLDTCIPGYRTAVQEINDAVSTDPLRVERPTPTYNRLEALIAASRQDQVRLILAAMPIRDPYQLDPELLQLLKQHNVPLIDCRKIPGITPEMFPDGVHMTREASELYSTFLAEQLTIETVGALLPRKARQQLANR